MNKQNRTLIYILSAIIIFFAGYSFSGNINNITNVPQIMKPLADDEAAADVYKQEEESSQAKVIFSETESISLDDIPEFSGKPYVAVNNNQPFFTESDYSAKPFEAYSELDSLGRCGAAYANICAKIMPTEKRGAIGMIKPTGWHTVRYDNVDGQYLYNRCHLIAYELAGENANERNLITGTRYMNVVGMLPFENMVADYVKGTHKHVLYRVTPMFEGSNLLVSGVLMEALSVEDKGEGICFSVFCYNVQPDIKIDYLTGESRAEAAETTLSEKNERSSYAEKARYIGNKNTKKFHYPYCGSVGQMLEKNKEYLYGSREDALAKGYAPCGACRP